MPTFIALLRGINVGGHNKLAMADLRDLVTAAGGTSVATYIQSGNVVFSHPARSAAKLTSTLEAAITMATRLEITVVVRTAAELAQVIANNPFARSPAEHLHVAFLASAPPRAALAGIDAKAFAPEWFALVGRELYLCLPDGIGRSKLAVALSRQKPAAAGTTRNWRTVNKLVELAGA